METTPSLLLYIANDIYFVAGVKLFDEPPGSVYL